MSAASIREIFVQLRDALKAKGVPFECVYGPTQVALSVGATRIQLLRDTDSGDVVTSPRGTRANPRQYALRQMGVIVRIHAMSTVAGAARYDHEELADRIADAVNVALHKIVRAANTDWRITRASFVQDLTVPEGWQGVTYEIRAQIDRGVADVTWMGDAAPEGSFTVGSTTRTATGPGISTSLPNATTEIS